jgi:lysophospholipase L1-like esterase
MKNVIKLLIILLPLKTFGQKMLVLPDTPRFANQNKGTWVLRLVDTAAWYSNGRRWVRSLNTKDLTSASSTDTTSLSNRINAKQNILISGSNIKTINGTSLLGSGDIGISVLDGYTIYNKTSWSSTGDFINVGSTTVSTNSKNKIKLSGGVGSYTKSIELTNPTGLEKWDFVMVSKIDTVHNDSYGIGVGIRSVNTYGSPSLCARVSTTNFSSNAGMLYIDAGESPSFSNIVNSGSTRLSFSQFDMIELRCSFDKYTVTFSVRNVTTNSSPIKLQYTYPTNGATPFAPNAGRFAIYNFGGSHEIQSIKITSNETLNSSLVIVGDSKSQYYNVSNIGKRYGSILERVYGSIVVNSGGYDRTTEVLLKIQDIINLKPAAVLLNIGSNDKRSGVSLGTYQTNYASITSQLQAAGITVYHLLQLNEAVLTFSDYNTWLNATYPGYIVNPGIINLAADNVHPSDIGNKQIADSVISQIGKYLSVKNTFNNDLKKLSINRSLNTGDSTFEVYGGLRFATGREHSGYVLTSDDYGGADWVALPGGGAGITGSGITGSIPVFTSSTNLTANANIVIDNSNTRIGIGTNSPQSPLHIVNQSGGFASGPDFEIMNNNSYGAVRFKNNGAVMSYFAQAGATFNNGIITANSFGLINQRANGDVYILTAGSGGGTDGGWIRFANQGYATTDERMGISPTGQVGIGTKSAGVTMTAGTIFQVESTTKAVMLPRMSTAQKNAITAVEGMEVYDLTLHQKSYYNGSAWINY